MMQHGIRVCSQCIGLLFTWRCASNPVVLTRCPWTVSYTASVRCCRSLLSLFDCMYALVHCFKHDCGYAFIVPSMTYALACQGMPGQSRLLCDQLLQSMCGV